MSTDVSEELVGAYLVEVLGCDHVLYNVRPKGGGVRGLDELDVVGLDFESRKAYLCEVMVHLHGLRFKEVPRGLARIRMKHEKQVRYASDHLKYFRNREYMFWSPYVPEGHLTAGLNAIEGLQLVINAEYTRRINEVLTRAKNDRRSTSNSAFRLLQIVEHLRPER